MESNGVEPSARSSRRARAWQAFTRNKLALLGLVLTSLFLLMAILPGLFSPFDPLEMHAKDRLMPPSAQFPLGSDQYGRDIMSRIIHGARISLQVAAMSMAIALFIGASLGLLAGYYGGWPDRILIVLMDILFAFPAILLALAIMAMLGSSTRNVMIAIGIVNIPVFQRLTRGSVLAVREFTFVEAAQVLGARNSRIIRQHILPNVTGPLIVQTTVGLAFAILVEAALSFLGLGTQPPTPSWGIMLSEGRKVMELAPWMAIYPGLAISLAVLAFNFVGDGLRDFLDPTTY